MENSYLDVNQYLCLDGIEHKNNFNNILLAIAKEIQSNNENISGKRNILLKITKYKASIKNKKYKIKHLNQTIRILRGIVKFLLNRKDREALQIKSEQQLSNTRFIEKFINRGYETLLKTLKELKEPVCSNISVLHKLKNIFAYTHLYYSNLEDIRTKCSFLEQRNRFFQNKINILESHLDSLIKENKNLHYQILRSKRENNFFKHKNIVINTLYSNELDKNKILNSFETIKYPVIQMANNLPKFRSHLSLISVLLSHQKQILQDIEQFYKVNVTNCT